MKLSPMEIQQKVFNRSFRGFNEQEVKNFLEAVASAYADVVRENNTMRETIARQEQEILQHRTREQTLKDTLVTAQRAVEEMRRNAQKQAELTVAEAELKADALVKDAHNRMADLQGQIQELKRLRLQFETHLRAELELHQKLLEAQSSSEAERAQIEKKVAFIKKGEQAG